VGKEAQKLYFFFRIQYFTNKIVVKNQKNPIYPYFLKINDFGNISFLRVESLKNTILFVIQLNRSTFVKN
jgi:hypothetical protein